MVGIAERQGDAEPDDRGEHRYREESAWGGDGLGEPVRRRRGRRPRGSVGRGIRGESLARFRSRIHGFIRSGQSGSTSFTLHVESTCVKLSAMTDPSRPLARPGRASPRRPAPRQEPLAPEDPRSRPPCLPGQRLHRDVAAGDRSRRRRGPVTDRPALRIEGRAVCSRSRVAVRRERDRGPDPRGPRRQVGEYTARGSSATGTATSTATRFSPLIHAALADPAAAAVFREFITVNLTLPVVERVGADRPQLRAALLASQLIGFGLSRYVLGFDALTSAPSEELIAALGATLQNTCTSPLSAFGPEAAEPAD